MRDSCKVLRSFNLLILIVVLLFEGYLEYVLTMLWSVSILLKCKEIRSKVLSIIVVLLGLRGLIVFSCISFSSNFLKSVLIYGLIWSKL